MNIVFVTYTYWPKKDGVQMVNQYLAEGLVKLGHNVKVLTTLREGTQRCEVYNGVEIYRFVCKKCMRIFTGEKREYQRYLLDNQENIDVVIAVCGQSPFAKWLLEISEQLHVKKIVHMHGMKDIKRLSFNSGDTLKEKVKWYVVTVIESFYFKRKWKKFMMFDAALHLFYDDSSHRYFYEHGFTSNYVLNNCCEDSLFEATGDTANLSKYNIEGKYFIYVANYCTGKNQMELLRDYYKCQNNEVQLVLVGSQKNNYYEKLCKENDVLYEKSANKSKAIIVVGAERSDVIALIKNSYAYIMTSVKEHYPVSIVEAMAAAKPYISTDVGVVSKIPGGIIARNSENRVYWMDYFANNCKFVSDLGKIAYEYAKKNCVVEESVKLLDNIIKQVVNKCT